MVFVHAFDLHAFLPLGYGRKPIPRVLSINGKGNNCGWVGFGRLELGVHVLQDEPCAHEKDLDIVGSTSGFFVELCARLLSSPVLLHVCVVKTPLIPIHGDVGTTSLPHA